MPRGGAAGRTPRAGRSPGLLDANPRDEAGDAPAVGGGEVLRELLQRGDRHVRVAALPERVGDGLDLAQRLLVLGLGKARLEDLEGRPEAAAGHAHVVDPLDVVGVEDVPGMIGELAGPDGDDLCRRRGVRLFRPEPLDRPRLRHHVTLAPAPGSAGSESPQVSRARAGLR